MTDEEKCDSFEEYYIKLSQWATEQRVLMYHYYLTLKLMRFQVMPYQNININKVNDNIPKSIPIIQQNARYIITPIQGQIYSLPHPVQRFVAEIIDYLLIMFAKIVILFIMQWYLSIDDISGSIYLDFKHFMDNQALAANNIAQTFNDTINAILGCDFGRFGDYDETVVYEELWNRLFITLFETLCLSGLLFSVSATPGKWLMGIRVVCFKDLYDFPESRVYVRPGSSLGLVTAFFRSVTKNVIIVFSFPLCLPVLTNLFNHHRTTYDLLTGTVVVKVSGARQGRLSNSPLGGHNPGP